VRIKNREDAARTVVDWYLSKPLWQYLAIPGPKIEWMLTIAKQFKCDGALIHYNRGCEMSTEHAPELRLAVIEAGIPVMVYEANHADVREFDNSRVQARIDAFAESLG
jgi:benzoyl-CoA reductase subunit B